VAGGEQGFAANWAGTSWTLQVVGNPSTTTELHAVSCTSSSSCEAVGSSDTGGAGAPATLAEHWDGSDWTVQSTPTGPLASTGYLSGVSCPTPRSCAAVGQQTSSSLQALVDVWDGTAWSVMPATRPVDPVTDQLNAVSCTALCIGVGTQDSRPLALSGPSG
jgi:hypothetical protein